MPISEARRRQSRGALALQMPWDLSVEDARSEASQRLGHATQRPVPDRPKTGGFGDQRFQLGRLEPDS